MDAYTKQAPDNYWAFVVLGDVVASNSRQTNTDAVSDIQRTEHFRQQLIQSVTVFVVVPSALENAARSARDACEALFRPLSRSLTFTRFDSGLAVATKGALQFVRHGFSAYHRAWYMHAYEFQQLADLTFDDTVGYDTDVAFRDITLQMKVQQGNRVEVMTANINLDDVGGV